MKHEHTFTEHVGVLVFGGVRAWVDTRFVTYNGVSATRVLPAEVPTVMRCRECGEQGYEIPERPDVEWTGCVYREPGGEWSR